MITTYLALMFPSKFPCTITASQFSTSAVITTYLPTTSTRFVPGGTIDVGPAGLGLGAGSTFWAVGGRGAGRPRFAFVEGSGEREVVGVVKSLEDLNDDFFLNMIV